MLRTLTITNFTAFRSAEVNLVEGINLFIGDNGCGKSHLLKLGCLGCVASHEYPNTADKTGFQRKLAELIVGYFLPDSLGRLTRREQGRQKAEVALQFVDDKQTAFSFSFSTNSKLEVLVPKLPKRGIESPPLFVPTKETISLFPGFMSLYETRELAIDRTYYELCKALSLPPLRGPRLAHVKEIITPLEEILGGTVVATGGRFVLRVPGQGNLEIPLVAEGMRKVAMIAFLLANGSLTSQGALFWDEPETNLNPHLIRKVAKLIYQLAKFGIQVNLATHSLFLLREIELLSKSKEFTQVPTRYFALGRTEQGVHITAGAEIADVDPLILLDEELKQSDAYLRLD